MSEIGSWGAQQFKEVSANAGDEARRSQSFAEASYFSILC